MKVTQTGDAVGDEQMMLELGKKMNPDLFYWDDVPEMLEFCTNNMATVPIHITFSELREKVIVYPEFEYYKYKTGKLRFDGNPGFNTLSGRVELFCNMYNNVGMDPLPYFKEPPESPESTPELFAEYPLVLTTGRRCWEYFHSEHRQLRSMREFHKWPMFAINPADAEAAGIKEGDWAVIENAHGKAIEVAHVTDTIMKGVVSAEHGWWFPERDKEEPSLYGVWESNINCLTVQGDFGPSGYGSSYKTQLPCLPGAGGIRGRVREDVRRTPQPVGAAILRKGDGTHGTTWSFDRLRVLHGLPRLRDGVQSGEGPGRGRVGYQARPDRALEAGRRRVGMGLRPTAHPALRPVCGARGGGQGPGVRAPLPVAGDGVRPGGRACQESGQAAHGAVHGSVGDYAPAVHREGAPRGPAYGKGGFA